MVNFLLLLLLHCFFFRNIKISYHDERVSLPERAPALWAVGDGGVLRVNRHDLGRNLTHCAPRNVRSDRGAGHLNQSIIWAAIIVKIQETINPSIFSLIRSHLVVVFFFFLSRIASFLCVIIVLSQKSSSSANRIHHGRHRFFCR